MSDPSPGTCADPPCPVPPVSPTIRSLRTVVWPAGTTLHRGHTTDAPDPTVLANGNGSARFEPLADVRHVHVATTPFAALLESALHDARPPTPRICASELDDWMASAVALTADVRLIDLRDPQLDRLDIDRASLVATTEQHYPCTRRWAATLHQLKVGGQPTHGLVWHSRQVELHAAALTHRPAVRDVISTAAAEVAILYSPPASRSLLEPAEGSLGPLAEAAGWSYVTDLTALLGITIL